VNLTIPGKHNFELTLDGLTRTFLVHVPSGYDGSRALPLVLAFHGAGGDAEKTAGITGWDRKADLEKFIVAFPNGLPPNPERPPSFLRNPQRWNAGSRRGAASRPAQDDVAFSSTIIDTIGDNYNLDSKRIYATGFSNGAAMCWRLGVDLSNRIAAIGPVAGYLAVQDPQPEKAVPAIVIACLNDPLIPIDGGIVKDIWSRQERNRPSVREVVKQYAVLCGCQPEPISIHENDGVTRIMYRPEQNGLEQNGPENNGPGTSVPGKSGPGKGEAEVLFYTIADAGHSYPGGREFLSERIVGKPTDKLNATDEIWEFFKTHP
jgi:polyhydroxybutyrate depolymerase